MGEKELVQSIPCRINSGHYSADVNIESCQSGAKLNGTTNTGALGTCNHAGASSLEREIDGMSLLEGYNRIIYWAFLILIFGTGIVSIILVL